MCDENSIEGLEYVIVRTYSAGVFAGYLKERNGKEGVILKSRRIWFWEGAATLSELATHGTIRPEKCKFPCEVEKTIVFDIIEILSTTKKAKESIKNVPVWSAKSTDELEKDI